jgi:hypothetical protein
MASYRFGLYLDLSKKKHFNFIKGTIASLFPLKPHKGDMGWDMGAGMGGDMGAG